MENKLAALLTFARYQESRSNVFETLNALEWAVRMHRAELQARRILVKVGGKKFLNAPAMDDWVLQVPAEAQA